MPYFNNQQRYLHPETRGRSHPKNKFIHTYFATSGPPSVPLANYRRSVRQLSLSSAMEGGFWGGRSPSQKATGIASRQGRESAAGAGRTDLRTGDKGSLRLWHKHTLSTTDLPTSKRAQASLWLEQSGRHSLAFGRPRKIWKTRRGFQFWRGSSGHY